MTPDSLESLSDQALSEVFACEVAGWPSKPRHLATDDGVTWTVRPGARVSVLDDTAPDFATSADAVLPWLEKWSLTERAEPEFFKMLSPLCKEQGWVCELWVDHHDGGYLESYCAAPTFARSACLALIKAHRAAKAP